MPGSFPFKDIVAQLPDAPGVPMWQTRAAVSVTELLIHHTAGPETQTPMQMHRFHQSKNWGTPEKPAFAPRITYHYLIAPDGTQYKTNLGLWVTWHCPKHNRVGISISLIGNREEVELPTVQYDSLVALSRSLLEAYPIGTHKVFFHRDFFPTLCPGRNLDRESLRRDIELSRIPEGGSLDGV